MLADKDLTGGDIIRKIRGIEGKGEKLMTILQEREMRGIEKGMERGRKAVARKLLSTGLPIEQIGVATDLTKEILEF